MRHLLVALALLWSLPSLALSDKQELIKSSKDYLVRLECHELSKSAVNSRYRVQSGVVIDKNLVLTSLDYINDSSVVNIFKYTTQKRFGAGLIWKDSLHNIAVFRVPELNATPIKMKSSKELSQIDEIMVFNCGRRDSTFLETTWGILSGSPKDTIITVGAAVNPGGVGAPVITMDGHLAGLIVDKEVDLFAEGIAYMANIDLVHDALSSIDANDTIISAIPEFETLDKLGQAFECEMQSYDTELISKIIELRKQSLDLATEAMKGSSTSIVSAYFKTYFSKLYFWALAEDYQETLAQKIYADYKAYVFEIRNILMKEEYPVGQMPENALAYLDKSKFDKFGIAAEKARMRPVINGLNNIKTSIRKADFYGYILYGLPPNYLKSVIKD